mmetsp:Transcript_66060/g.167433  ORF Transcript_66060/g.167433 Transcript_66060/m.167433 type:complete len:260 (+) Transcript_66060:878-1657(+)
MEVNAIICQNMQSADRCRGAPEAEIQHCGGPTHGIDDLQSRKLARTESQERPDLAARQQQSAGEVVWVAEPKRKVAGASVVEASPDVLLTRRIELQHLDQQGQGGGKVKHSLLRLVNDFEEAGHAAAHLHGAAASQVWVIPKHRSSELLVHFVGIQEVFARAHADEGVVLDRVVVNAMHMKVRGVGGPQMIQRRTAAGARQVGAQRIPEEHAQAVAGGHAEVRAWKAPIVQPCPKRDVLKVQVNCGHFDTQCHIQPAIG